MKTKAINKDFNFPFGRITMNRTRNAEVTLPTPMPDDQYPLYLVVYDCHGNEYPYQINKTPTGFKVHTTPLNRIRRIYWYLPNKKSPQETE
jgi:hypothetical protein